MEYWCVGSNKHYLFFRITETTQRRRARNVARIRFNTSLSLHSIPNEIVHEY